MQVVVVVQQLAISRLTRNKPQYFILNKHRYRHQVTFFLNFKHTKSVVTLNTTAWRLQTCPLQSNKQSPRPRILYSCFLQAYFYPRDVSVFVHYPCSYEIVQIPNADNIKRSSFYYYVLIRRSPPPCGQHKITQKIVTSII